MASSSTTAPRSLAALSITLWIVQLLLAVAFVGAGLMKSTQPMSALAGPLPWTQDLPELLVRFIGVSELAAAIGLLLPSLTRINPVLTPVAAAALVLVMLLASAFHASRSEWQNLPVTLTLAVLAAFVAWGRFTRAPITPRARAL
jgi:putative oxidoreductase